MLDKKGLAAIKKFIEEGAEMLPGIDLEALMSLHTHAASGPFDFFVEAARGFGCDKVMVKCGEECEGCGLPGRAKLILTLVLTKISELILTHPEEDILAVGEKMKKAYEEFCASSAPKSPKPRFRKEQKWTPPENQP